MGKPYISVIMPVYNADEYIGASINSILGQTYKDFELIIINDGSTDNTHRILDKYSKKDVRIQLVEHDNRGIGPALNEAISLATGRYIARMDADDISLPTRFEKQKQYLDKHKDCGALFTKIELINKSAKTIEDWEADTRASSTTDIRTIMPVENCCAHPTLMIRSEILKQFMYDESQVPSEDYDLWLRLLSAGYELHKIDEKLLQYRMHDKSISQLSNKKSSPERKYIRAKSKFLLKQTFGLKFGKLELDVFKSLIKLLASLVLSNTTKYFRRFFPKSFSPSSSFKLAGRNLRHLKAQVHIKLNFLKMNYTLVKKRVTKTSSDILVIVPWMKVGGAEKILLDLMSGFMERGYRVSCISTVKDSNPWGSVYQDHCDDLIDLGRISLEENKTWFISKYVSLLGIKYVFTTNNFAGYRAAEKIKQRGKKVRIFDILHGQGGDKEGGGWPFLSLDYDRFMDKRITVTSYLKNYIVRRYGIKSDKIQVIHNGVSEPGSTPSETAAEIKKNSDKFIVLWAGRFSYEKHPELALSTIAKLTDDIHLILVGEGDMRPELENMIIDLGINKKVTLSAHPYSDYRTYMCHSDLLLMTSEMEGLPIVILEALSVGLPVIAPRVGGIPEIIKNGYNGALIKFSDEYPEEAAKKIVELSQERRKLEKMSNNAHLTAMSNFTMDKMINQYVGLLESS